MQLLVENTTTTVQKCTAPEDTWLRAALSQKRAVKGFRGVKKGVEELTLYDSVTRSFPSGLIPELSTRAKADGITLTFTDKRVKPCEPKEENLFFLADDKRGPYQLEALRAGVEWGRGIYWCPTAFGKTMLAIGLGKWMRCKWAFIVDEASLVGQSMDRWNAWDFDDEPAGILADGRWQDARFVVATYQSLRERLHEPEIQAWIASVGGILLDELHVASAPTHYDIAMSFTNAYFRFGLSATPLSRTPWDNLRVMALTGRVIYKANVPEMVAAGVLAMPIVYMQEFTHKESMSPTYQGVYGDLIVSNAKRNKDIIAVTQQAEKPAILFVKQINHGEDLLERALKAGIKAEFIHAKATLAQRKACINRLVSGEIDVIITNKIFQKGVDIPTLNSVIIAASGKSVVDSLQRVGRGTRIAEGKEIVDVYDWMDRGNDWLLYHSRERKKAYVAAGYVIAGGSAQTPLLPFTK